MVLLDVLVTIDVTVVIAALLLLTWGFVIDYKNHKKYPPPRKERDPFQEYLDGLK